VIHHTVIGDGPPVVLLHGGTGSSESYWSSQVPVLGEHFRLILMDHRGFGESDYEGEFSIPACAGDLAALLDELEVESASIVGLSLGGAIGLQFALDHPERVRRLVLADSFSGVFTEHFRRFINFALIESIQQGGHDLMFRDWSVDDRLGEIEAPTLVLWGTEDIEVPRVYSQRLVDGLPHAVLSLIDGAGHKSCADRPEAFNKAVLAFLKDRG
jgi:pimeloyl-ACP methyl ester carboxylesterase